MAYAQIDTGALSHPKILRLTAEAFRVWVAGLAYCQEHLTDGRIPGCALAALPVHVTRGDVDELLAAGLWRRDGAPDQAPNSARSGARARRSGLDLDVVYLVHDYLQWNDSKEVVEQKRARWRDEKRRKRGGRRKMSAPDTGAESAPDTGTESRAESACTIRSDTQRSDQENANAFSFARDGGRAGHRSHVFCSAAFCVPAFKHEELHAQLGTLRDRVDLLGWYRRLSEHQLEAAEPIPHLTRWLDGKFAELVTEHERVRKASGPSYAWTCPHTPECVSRWACARLDAPVSDSVGGLRQMGATA